MKQYIVDILKEARKHIARLAPFRTELEKEDILLKAIKETSDYADDVGKKVNDLIRDIENDTRS
jgi:hypothetical protein